MSTAYNSVKEGEVVCLLFFSNVHLAPPKSGAQDKCPHLPLLATPPKE